MTPIFTPPRPDRVRGPFLRAGLAPRRSRPQLAAGATLRTWFVARWRENPPLINFASVGLLALGLAQVAIGIILLSR